MKISKKILIITLLGFLLFSCNGKKVSETSSSSLIDLSITSQDESSTNPIDPSSITSEDNSSSSEEEKSSDNIVGGDELQSDWDWDK